ncbi:Transmembrane protein 17A [Merluccius polli]|uniref:Transmembrane protein 17A n=1 Tax=Merluccius polli TaxID=89951 RepID=A0AA47NY77_MERPO|nr:Transmembrane protein 17A [Merluccius polli]
MSIHSSLSLSLSLSLSHQVPELAAFWLLSVTFQLPVLLFFLTDEAILILPLERAVHAVYLFFLLAQIASSFLALRTMTQKLTLLFHLRQVGELESFHPHHHHHHHHHPVTLSPLCSLPPHHRSVLPLPDGKDSEPWLNTLVLVLSHCDIPIWRYSLT